MGKARQKEGLGQTIRIGNAKKHSLSDQKLFMREFGWKKGFELSTSMEKGSAHIFDDLRK